MWFSEHFGDGDSKGFNELENTYTEAGLRIVKNAWDMFRSEWALL